MGIGGTPPGVQQLATEPHRSPLVKVAVILGSLIKLSQTGLKATSLWNYIRILFSLGVRGQQAKSQQIANLQIPLCDT